MDKYCKHCGSSGKSIHQPSDVSGYDANTGKPIYYTNDDKFICQYMECRWDGKIAGIFYALWAIMALPLEVPLPYMLLAYITGLFDDNSNLVLFILLIVLSVIFLITAIIFSVRYAKSSWVVKNVICKEDRNG